MGRKKAEINNQNNNIKKPKAIGPFDIIKLMFTNIQEFDKLSNLLLERNSFMINRIFSIQFPQQAQCFNNMKISGSDVVKAWRLFAVKTLGFGKMPSFIYTKGAKKTSDNLSDKKDNISKDLKESYCIHYNLSTKDFEDLLYFYHDDFINHINQYEKITSTNGQKTMFIKN